MGNRTLSLAAAAFCFAWGMSALAQPNDPPSDVPGMPGYYLEHPEEFYRGPYTRRWYRDRARDYVENRLRGAGPSRDLRIGHPLPPQFRHHQYAVENWRAYRLVQPPAGYRWYMAGADYVLVDMSTGIIAHVLLAR